MTTNSYIPPKEFFEKLEHFEKNKSTIRNYKNFDRTILRTFLSIPRNDAHIILKTYFPELEGDGLWSFTSEHSLSVSKHGCLGEKNSRLTEVAKITFPNGGNSVTNYLRTKNLLGGESMRRLAFFIQKKVLHRFQYATFTNENVPAYEKLLLLFAEYGKASSILG